MVSYKTLIEEDFNSNEGCKKLYLKPSQKATEEEMSLYLSKLQKHYVFHKKTFWIKKNALKAQLLFQICHEGKNFFTFRKSCQIC